MSPNSDPSVEALLAETGWLRGLALALVGEADGADELAQETLVVALERRPAARGSLRPWLRTVAQRLWIDRQRAGARRVEAAEERTGSAPATDETVARFELHTRVAATVHGLPEPYRTAVLLRFYEDLPPRDVAARLGVPVETARTRVRRGLALVRESLDERHGHRAAWALPLVERFGRPEIGTSTILTGAALMSPKSIAVAISITAIALTAWLVDLGGAPSAGGPDDAEAPAERVALAEPEIERDDPDPAQGVRALETLDGARSAVAVREEDVVEQVAAPRGVHGRVVAAEDGSPVVGALIEWVDLSRYSPGPGAPAPSTATSGPDGTFELGGTPSASQPWMVTVRSEGRGAIEALLDHSTPTDLGTLTLVLGSPARGRVVDEQDRPQAGVRFRLDRVSVDDAATLFKPLAYEVVESDAFGRFETAPLGQGEWIVHEMGRRIVSSTRVTVPSGGRWVDLEVVTWIAPDADRIEGRVTDARGGPIEGAWVFSIVGMNMNTVTTGEGGGFLIERPEGFEDAELGLTAQAAGFAPARVQLPWGLHDAEIVLPDGVELPLRVVRASDGRPVEDFGVRILMREPRLRTGWSIRDQGQHAGGELTLDGLAEGQMEIVVLPEESGLLPSAPRVLPTHSNAPVQVFALESAVTRELVVTSAEGPVASSFVTLRDPRVPGGRPLAADIGPGGAVELSTTWTSTVTDEQGRATLRGPAGAQLELFIEGAVHEEYADRRFELTAGDEPIRIEVEAGRTLEVLLRPQRVVDQFRARTGGLRLADAEGRGLTHKHRIDADGRSLLAAIPDHDAELHLEFNASISPDQYWSWHANLGPVALNGSSRTIEVDVSGLEFAEVRGAVRVDDEPLGNGEILFEGERVLSTAPAASKGSDRGALVGAAPAPRVRKELGGSAAIGEDGSFVISLLPGRWRPFHEATGATGEWFTLRPGETLHVDFDVASPSEEDGEGDG